MGDGYRWWGEGKKGEKAEMRCGEAGVRRKDERFGRRGEE